MSILVAGCGGAPEPTAIETPKPTAPKESTPKPKQTSAPDAKPTKPDDVKVTGGSGKVDPATASEVKEFIADYLTAQNKATGNGDFSAVDKMLKKCQICAESKQYITSAYRSGGGVEGGIFTSPTIAVTGQRDSRVQVSVHAVISAYETTDGSGKVVDKGPAETQNFQYSVSKIDGRWLIVEGSFVG